MACRCRRLGTVLSDPVDAALSAVTRARPTLIDIARLLSETPAPNGDERAATEALHDWCRAKLPELATSIDVFDETRANLVIAGGTGTGPDLGMYAHLDTSLTADADRDAMITGRSDALPALRLDRSPAAGAAGGELVGQGLAVARAVVAAAIVGLHAATAALSAAGIEYRLRLLLAAGGTHRWPINVKPELGDSAARFGVGARRALANGFHPDALLNVKAGAPAPLHEEPGAAYLTVRIHGTWEPALFRSTSPGTLAVLGPLVEAVECWRTELVARPTPHGSTSGREAALGAVTAGAMDKPDLLPALVSGRVFLVLVPGDDPVMLAAQLRAEIEAALQRAATAQTRVRVDVDVLDNPGRTPPDSPIVALANTVWTARFGQPPTVVGWRGSTDGVVFRNAGIPTVRVGPQVTNDAADLRLDRVGVDELLTFAGIYA
ncbi:MAG: hypothetical protein ABIQ39_15430, partial [Ilumatobacteraceae bacterium]